MKERLGHNATHARDTAYRDIYINVLRGGAPGAAEFFSDSMLALWEEDGHTMIVFETPAEEAVRAFVSQNCPDAEFLWQGRMDYKDWESNRRFAPVHTAGFLICPAWDAPAPEPRETRIVLDPGLSFGTGMHPTTQNSLALLRLALRAQPAAHVLDLGCGSGVLAIASALLGAQRVTAVDNSLLAVNAARINAELNAVQDKIRIIHDDIFNHLADPADLVVCNINFGVVHELPAHSEFTAQNRILLSGVNPEKMHRQVSAAMQDAGHEILHTLQRNIWYSYLTQRRAPESPA